MPRIVIISDTHLGRPSHAARSADALRPLWEGAAHLVVNGDVADVHHPHHRGEAARQTLRLLDLCEADGVGLTLLSGNHDPFLTDRRHLVLAGGAVFVTHGDVFHPAIAPWSPVADRLERAHARALASLPATSRDALEGRLAAAQHAAQAEWIDPAVACRRTMLVEMVLRPHRCVGLLAHWRRLPRLAAAFASEHAPEARFVVFGHMHRHGIWTHHGRVIVNTGSYGFPGHPWAVVLEDGLLSVCPIVRRGDRYVFADRVPARYELPPSAPSTLPVNGRPSVAAITRPASTSRSSVTPVEQPIRSHR